MKKLILLTTYILLTGCANGPKTLSYADASAFERALLAQKTTTTEVPERLYVQPANKKEACKLPTTQDQLDRPNFRAYWDGECKNGFAFGLGRDIAISDTHHLEEITIHDGTGNNWSQPSVNYDYVNNLIGYSVGGSTFPAGTKLSEKMDNSVSGFNAYHQLRVVDEHGNIFVVYSSAFHPQRTYLNTRIDGAISYRFTDYSAKPLVDQTAPVFTVETIDPKNNISGGVAIARYADGSVRHFKINNGTKELVSLPAKYTSHLSEKYQEILNATSQASTNLQKAQQIEREYLFKACNGKGSVEGLDMATYMKICTWREQFKEPYAIASANYQKTLENMKQQAATAEQQRQIQQQIALQQQVLAQQQSQQAWNALGQVGRDLQQSGQQMLQSINNSPVPQVQPLTLSPLGGNKVVCTTIGSITTCR